MNQIRTMSLPIARLGNEGSGLPVAQPLSAHVPATQTAEDGSQVAQAALPTGQNINVVTNHNIHLPFRDWLLRGLIGAVGSALAFPFRLVGGVLNSIAQGVVSILKMAIIVVLIPTLIWLGIELQEKMQEQASVEDGAAEMVHQAGDVVSGIGKGISQPKDKE